MRMNLLLPVMHQVSWFTLISGLGWCIDFFCYSVMSMHFGVPIERANMLSAVPGVTFVFFFATRHIFEQHGGRLPLRYKYFVYLFYEMLLILFISYLAGLLYLCIVPMASGMVSVYFADISMDNIIKAVVKCLVTPISMICNFVFMKVLIERV